MNKNSETFENPIQLKFDLKPEDHLQIEKSANRFNK